MPDTAEFFDWIFRNAKQNALMIMNGSGIIMRVNEAFTDAYGYTPEDLQDKHFRVLYTEKDQVIRLPELELNTTHREGASSDENYLVHKDGTPIWVTGESILVDSPPGEYIVKIIHNIHALKQLERFLLTSHELLDSLFNSVKQTGLLLLDTQMRTLKANGAFAGLFGLEAPVTEGIRLREIHHPFWQDEEIKTDVLNALTGQSAINKDFIVNAGRAAAPERLHIVSKLMRGETTEEKQLLLVIKKA